MSLIALVAGLLAESTSAYPIPPRPLRQLVRESELIVVAKAGATVEFPKDEKHGFRWKVSLTIDRIVKGKCDKQITVLYQPNLACPAPAEFPEGKVVLAFLAWSDPAQAYYVPGLSYGTKVVDVAGLELYLLRIDDLSKIPAEKADEPACDATVDWLVRCIESPVTRWEGAYEFTRSSFRLARQGDPEPIPLRRLKKDQWTRILDAFTQPHPFESGDVHVLQMVADMPDARIDRYLIDELKRQRSKKDPWYSADLIETLSQRLDLREGRVLAEKYNESYAEKEDPRLPLIDRFLQLLEKK
jgi:hypothetical protein